MKPGDLMIRCLAMREGGQWVAICLPFDLAAQAESLPEVKQKLEAQIREYLYDALMGEDREHADQLLHRRAPLKYWALYHVAGIAKRLRTFGDSLRQYKTTVPLAPAAC